MDQRPVEFTSGTFAKGLEVPARSSVATRSILLGQAELFQAGRDGHRLQPVCGVAWQVACGTLWLVNSSALARLLCKMSLHPRPGADSEPRGVFVIFHSQRQFSRLIFLVVLRRFD